MSHPAGMIGAMSSRAKVQFRCDECGAAAPVWHGRCGGCGAWNTLRESRQARLDAEARATGHGVKVEALGAIDLADVHTIGVGIDEVDRVLDGGLVPGSVTLVSGPPGVGKSTLSLQIARELSGGSTQTRVLYVAAEETPAQVRTRSDRLGTTTTPSLLVLGDTDLEVIVDALSIHRPDVVIIDSIQAIADGGSGSVAGSTTQVRTCAQSLAAWCREASASLVLIGHVTKDGSIAGPRTLEHLVDTILTFDADLDHGLRFLRAVKHRFGPIGELGVFTMESDGLRGVRDVSGRFLTDRRAGVPGSVVTTSLEGRRSLVVEVQALVDVGGSGGVRVCEGLNRGRVELIRAVVVRNLGITGDVFASVAGGIALGEPAGDLAVAIAMISAAVGVPVDPATVICGELGLVGEVRGVPSIGRRLSEAARLGFTRAIVPRGVAADAKGSGLDIEGVGDLEEAVRVALRGLGSSVSYRGAQRTMLAPLVEGGDVPSDPMNDSRDWNCRLVP